MTPHKSLGQEVKNSAANWGEDEEGCRSRRQQWLGLEHSQHDVVNTSVVMKSTSVISGQSLISQKACCTAQWPFPSIRGSSLFIIQQETCSHQPYRPKVFLLRALLQAGTTMHTSLTVLTFGSIFILMLGSSQHLLEYILSQPDRTEKVMKWVKGL